MAAHERDRPDLWETLVQPGLRSGARLADMRTVWRSTAHLGTALEQEFARRDVGAFLALHARHRGDAVAYMPALLWDACYRAVFAPLLPGLPNGVGRRGVTPLIAALVGGGSIKRAAADRGLLAQRAFSLVRTARVGQVLAPVLEGALAAADLVIAGCSIEYEVRRIIPPSALTDDEWRRVVASVRTSGGQLDQTRGLAGLWVWAEMTGEDAERELAGIGRRVGGWEGFLSRFVPYLRPALVEIARQRLAEAGFEPTLACEDPANLDFDPMALTTTPVERPRWIGRRRIPADRCLDDLRRAAAEVGEPLTRRAYDVWARRRMAQDPRVADSVVSARFGSWADGCAAAGVRCGPDPLTEARLIDAVRDVAQRHGGPLSSATYKRLTEHNPDLPSCSSVVTAFGAWADACAAAGVDAAEPTPVEDMIAAMQSAAVGGSTLTAVAYEAWRAAAPAERPIPEYVIRWRFGDWSSALASAGLGADAPPRHWQTQDELIDALRCAAGALSGDVTQESYRELRATSMQHLPSVSTVIKRIGSWSEAKRLAAVESPSATPGRGSR